MKQRSNLMRQLTGTSRMTALGAADDLHSHTSIVRRICSPCLGALGFQNHYPKIRGHNRTRLEQLRANSDLLLLKLSSMKLSFRHYPPHFSWPALGKLTISPTSLPTTKGECFCKRTVQNASKEMFGETLPPQLYLPLTSHQRTRNMYIFLIFRGHYPLSHLSTSPTFQSLRLLPNNSSLQRKQLRLRA